MSGNINWGLDKMIKAGRTLGLDNEFTDVWQCEFCGSRSRDKGIIIRCEISCHHEAEAEVRLL